MNNKNVVGRTLIGLCQISIAVVFSVFTSLAQGSGDLVVSGATVTNDLAIMALDCSAYNSGGTLTTDENGIVVCSDDDGTTGPHTVDTDDQSLYEVLTSGNDANHHNIVNVNQIETTKIIVSEVLQILAIAGPPPAWVTCDSEIKAGIMVFDKENDLLYICSGASGWIAK